MKRKDIKNRKDIEKIVFVFYEKIKTDETIGYYFKDVVAVNWDLHLPKMIDFWDNILFYTGNYDGNPMEAHRQLNAKTTMQKIHFTHWTHLFKETVDELFLGDKAEEMKLRAENIAQAMIEKTTNSQ